MGFMFTGIFWGLVLILFGVSVVVKAVFHIHIPIVRIFFALVLIWMGVRLLIGHNYGRSCRGGNNTIMFSEGTIRGDGGSNEYTILFGNGTIDLSGVVLTDQDVKIEVNAIFGAATVKLNPDIPTVIAASAAFGNTVLPDGNSIAFGDRTQSNNAAAEKTGARLLLEANAVFGKLDMVNK